jgi:hypothetical protein
MDAAMKYSVVTTFNASGYNRYASKMIDTFLKNWPEEVHLYVYAEDCTVTQSAPNLTVYDLHAQCPRLLAFKEKYKNDPRATGQQGVGPVDKKGKQHGVGFRWDAVRFSNKVYAMCDAASRTLDTVIWMDADMVCHSPITVATIQQLIPADANIAFLGRERKFTETGLWAINMGNSANILFIQWMQAAYDNAETGVLAMEEFHDCWVFDRTRERIAATVPAWTQLNWSANFSKQGEGHPLINTEWGKYLDHLKGNRKDYGKSLEKDLINPRAESYWALS